MTAAADDVTSASEATSDGSTGDAEEGSESGSDGAAMPPFDASFIEEQVDAALAAGVPGLAIAVVSGDAIVHAKGYGSAGASGPAVEAHTLFNLASVTKSVTAMALLGQRDDGLVALADPVIAHVPYFGLDPAFDPASVTLEHLLLHTSGVGDYETEPFVYTGSLASSFAMNANQPLWAPAGAIHNYSNRGYALAGLVAAEVDTRSYADTVVMRVLGPLGMDDATMDASVALGRAHAEGRSGSDWVGPADLLGELYQPPAGLWAGAEDLGALLLGLLAREDMLQPHQPTHEGYGQHYGYGLYVETGTDPIVVHHGGSTAGFLAAVKLVPARSFGVAVVINADDVESFSIADDIVDHYAGPIGSANVDLPEVDSALVPGTYSDPWQLGTIEIAADSVGGLSLTFVELVQTVPMNEAWAGMWFVDDPVTGYELDVHFWPDAAGNPTHLVTRRGIAARM